MATFTPTSIVAKNSVSSGFQELINSGSVFRPANGDLWKKALGWCKLWFTSSYPVAPHTEASLGIALVKQMKESYGGGGKASHALSALLSKYF